MDEEEAIRQAMSIIGSRKTERKIESALENVAKANATPMTEERRERIRQAQSARRERERAEAAANPAPAKEPKRMGRPPKPRDPDAVKRPRGRPKKQDGEIQGQGG
jgi:hypothetical protein